MIIISKETDWKDLKNQVDLSQGFVKAVVDLKQGLLGVEAKEHAQIAAYFKEHNHSDDLDLWGIRIHLDGSIEYNSLLNRNNNYAHGFEVKSYSILDEAIKNQVSTFVMKMIQNTFPQ